MATQTFISLMVFAPVAVIAAGVVGTLVVTSHDGLSMDRFALAAVRFNREPHELATLPPDAAPIPGVSRLGLPVMGVSPEGIVDLGSNGSAIIGEATAVGLGLRSEIEQEALTEAFGRFCNSLDIPVQFVIRTEPIDLDGAIATLRTEASTLPSIGLERAALDHARFLVSLTGRHDVLRRVVLLVFRDASDSATASVSLLRRAHDAAMALQAAGVELRTLDGPEASVALQRASAPGGSAQPLVFDDSIITKGQP